MFRRIGLPFLGLMLALMFLVPSHADARVHFGIFVGPSYPAYPYAYSYPYAYPYPGYYYDPYYYPYTYSYGYPYGYWGSGYYWRGHRDRDDYRGWARGGRGYRGERAYHGGGRGYGRGRR